MKQVVIYPGRFQPMLSHHAEVYKQLQAQFPDSEVFIGTSDKVELPKSPFNFKEKQQIAAAHGIPADRVLAVTRTYHQEDYAKYFNPAETIIVFAVGEKDLDRFPFNNVDPKTGLDMTVRGEAKPKYFQKINTLKASPKPMSERGYITLAPTIKIGDVVVTSYNAANLTEADIADAKAAATKKLDDVKAANKPEADIKAATAALAAFDKNAKAAAAKVKDGQMAAALSAALKEKGYPAKADPAKVNKVMVIAILTYLVILVTMVYGPIAAMLVEMFPTRIRYTSMSLPYHIGNGWFGGLLPTTAFAIVAQTGNMYNGLWYPIIIAGITFVIGMLFVKETKDVDIYAGD